LTGLGVGAAAAAAILLAVGAAAGWPAVVIAGAGTALGVLLSLAYVSRRPRLAIERQVEPARVQKGSAAVAVVHATNLSRRPLAPVTMEQRVGDEPVALRLPRLRRGEAVLRSYRLPTWRRGEFEIGPVEVAKADPLGLCRTVLALGEPQSIAVHPRLLQLTPLPAGRSRHLEGPSSDMSPQGSITFHRLREYVAGDDLRTIHWPSTARTGTLMVRHNVDTAQPYTVVLLDVHPSSYSAETFEEAVDVAASVATSMSGGVAPVQLRTTAGERMGGPAQRDPRPLVDHLTGVAPSEEGSLDAQLAVLRRDRGGTALVVVTGKLTDATVPAVSTLRRRFDRVVLASLAAGRVPGAAYPGVTVLAAATADGVARAWAAAVARSWVAGWR
jgi:uncharacterized protein (DUF58 family)